MEAPVASDLALASRLAESLDREKGVAFNCVLSTPSSSPSEQLDVLVAYLWAVHSYSFYTAEEFDGEVERDIHCAALPTRETPEKGGADVGAKERENLVRKAKETETKNSARCPSPPSSCSSYLSIDPTELFFRLVGQKYSVKKRKVDGQEVFRCNTTGRYFVSESFVGMHVMKQPEGISSAEMEELRLQQSRELFLSDGRRPRVEIEEARHRDFVFRQSERRGGEEGEEGANEDGVGGRQRITELRYQPGVWVEKMEKTREDDVREPPVDFSDALSPVEMPPVRKAAALTDLNDVKDS